MEFFAIYVVPEEVWYIIPSVVVLRLRSNIRLAPRVAGQKYEPYMEASELLRYEKAEARAALDGGK